MPQYTHARTCMCMRAHGRVHVRACTCIRVCIHACVHTCVHTCMCAYMHVCMLVHACACLCMLAHACVHAHVSVCGVCGVVCVCVLCDTQHQVTIAMGKDDGGTLHNKHPEDVVRSYYCILNNNKFHQWNLQLRSLQSC